MQVAYMQKQLVLILVLIYLNLISHTHLFTHFEFPIHDKHKKNNDSSMSPLIEV
jgi:hypothetical protein